MTKIKIQCDNCNKSFYRKERSIREHNHQFCCVDCYLEYRTYHSEEYSTNRYSKQLKKLLEIAEKRNVETKEE